MTSATSKAAGSNDPSIHSLISSFPGVVGGSRRREERYRARRTANILGWTCVLAADAHTCVVNSSVDRSNLPEMVRSLL